MRRRSISEADLSDRPGNPAASLKASYQKLMSIQDPVELYDMAMEVVGQHAEKGMSKGNLATFQANMKKVMAKLRGGFAPHRVLRDLQGYLTNFILKADNLGVIEGRIITWGEIVSDPIEAIGSMLDESMLALSPSRRHFVRVAQQYGINIRVFSEEETIPDKPARKPRDRDAERARVASSYAGNDMLRAQERGGDVEDTEREAPSEIERSRRAYERLQAKKKLRADQERAHKARGLDEPARRRRR